MFEWGRVSCYKSERAPSETHVWAIGMMIHDLYCCREVTIMRVLSLIILSSRSFARVGCRDALLFSSAQSAQKE